MRRRRIFAWCGLGALTAAGLVWLLAPFCVDDPLVELRRRTPVRVWQDCRGEVIWYERTHDGEWRFPVRLEEIPADVRRFMLNVEDSRFYTHGGVDYLSVARALLQDLASLRIVSGASTISMQVSGLAWPKAARFFLPSRLVWKFLQAARARRLERLHTKDEILEAYFNNLPYGGKIVGIRSAAEYFFGLKVSELTLAEASLLVGIPQSPNRLRPDRFPDAARRRQRLVLASQVRKGFLARAAAERIFAKDRLRYRDFTLPTVWEAKGNVREWGFLTNAIPAEGTEGGVRRLPLDAALCADVRRILKRRLGGGVRDAAAVVLDVPSGEMRGYVGTVDFDSAAGGQVDAVRAVRSAGSTLKPFVYLEALAGGLIGPETVLLDAPLRYGGYAPANYDGTYRGEVTATEALSQSLNTPVVRLLAALGEGRVSAAFARYGLVGTVKTNGLALALGSAGYRLLDIAGAYRRLARDSVAADSPVVRATQQLSRMLRTRPLADATGLDVAWKTGTSNNLRDAWCFAYTPAWVVGVWYGNKDGKSSPRLVGADIAAPAAGEILARLYENRPPPTWPQARSFRGAPRDGTSAPRAPPTPTMVLSPVAQVYRLPPGETALTLDLRCSEPEVYWFWNGTGLGSVEKVAFPAGRHRVVAVPRDAAKREVAVDFTVVGPDAP